MESAEQLEAETKIICDTYGKAEEFKSQGIELYSIDECTGIQALERNSCERPIRQGKPRRVEFEYTRHGTQTLIGNFDVLRGKIDSPYVNDTHTEIDFAKNIENLLKTKPEAKGWIFVVDQLNTHKSETLVKLIAQYCKIDKDLGVKGRKGILKSMKTRMEFLMDSTHKVSFIYTPKHCSWLNQIEIWFSILSKKFIKWGNFKSQKDLKSKLLQFIYYFNNTMAKPYKWTFKGFPLRA